jgi:16S rRNA (cytidine1402-2'-O)-methyltransferase
MPKTKPALLLLPNLLGEHRYHEVFLPSSVDRAVETIDGLIAESVQGGRRFLSRFHTEKPANDIPIALLNVNTPEDELDFLLEPIRKGERWGYVVDAGVPCVADPGAKLVRRAQRSGIIVQAFVGPSSILLALMLSGLQGQRFCFLGYLEQDPGKRKRQIIQLESISKRENATQIFIETPYRNRHLLESLVETLSDETDLCVAWDLTLPTQGIVTQPVKVWKKSPLPNIEKKPAIFLFCG